MGKCCCGAGNFIPDLKDWKGGTIDPILYRNRLDKDTRDDLGDAFNTLGNEEYLAKYHTPGLIWTLDIETAEFEGDQYPIIVTLLKNVAPNQSNKNRTRNVEVFPAKQTL